MARVGGRAPSSRASWAPFDHNHDRDCRYVHESSGRADPPGMMTCSNVRHSAKTPHPIEVVPGVTVMFVASGHCAHAEHSMFPPGPNPRQPPMPPSTTASTSTSTGAAAAAAAAAGFAADLEQLGHRRVITVAVAVAVTYWSRRQERIAYITVRHACGWHVQCCAVPRGASGKGPTDRHTPQ